MPALLNSSGTSSHSRGRTLCRGITYSHASSSSASGGGGFLCTAGAECARESFPDLPDLNLAPWPNSGKLAAATAANRAAAMAVCCCCCFGRGLREPLLDGGDPVWSSPPLPLLLLPAVGEGVHGSEVVPGEWRLVNIIGANFENPVN